MFRSPLFGWSPQTNHDPFATPPTQSPSRFGALPGNIRTMFNGSSIYSQSPALGPSGNNSPKVPSLGFLGRHSQSPNPNLIHISTNAARELATPLSPLHPQHTAGSYLREIAPPQDPQEPTAIYSRHPADVSLPSLSQDIHEGPSATQVADRSDNHKRRRKHKKRKHRRAGQWVRHRNETSGRGVMLFVRGNAARSKMIACIISGALLVTILAICECTFPDLMKFLFKHTLTEE